MSVAVLSRRFGLALFMLAAVGPSSGAWAEPLPLGVHSLSPLDETRLPPNRPHVYGVGDPEFGAEATATWCDDPDGIGEPCEGQSMAREALVCDDDYGCLFRYRFPGDLVPGTVVRVQLENPPQGFAFIEGRFGADAFDDPDAPLLGAPDVQFEPTVVVTSINAVDDGGLGHLLVFMGDADEAELSPVTAVLPGANGTQSLRTAVADPAEAREVCVQYSAVDLAGNESPRSERVCGEVGGAILGALGGCTHVETGRGGPAGVLALVALGWRTRRRRRRA